MTRKPRIIEIRHLIGSRSMSLPRFGFISFVSLLSSFVIVSVVHELIHLVFSSGQLHEICALGWNMDHPGLGWAWIAIDTPAYWTEGYIEGWPFGLMFLASMVSVLFLGIAFQVLLIRKETV
jgi:hypothetical protein